MLEPTTNMGDHDIRMQEYERKEQDFLQFINQTRREREEPLTPESCVGRTLTAPTKGLQCLLALSRLLEQTVNMTVARINTQKDLTDLLELRRQAERMGHYDHQKAATNSYEKLDSLSMSDEHHRFYEEPVKAGTGSDQHSELHHENQKSKALKSGAQMLTGTLGKVKTKLMKTTGNHKDLSSNTSPSASTTSFAQRKLGKVHGPFHPPLSIQSSDSEIVRNSARFEQRQLLTPPTPRDLGDIWLGTDVSNSEQFIVSGDVGKHNSLNVLATSNPSSPQVASNEFEKAFVTRRMSELPRNESQVQQQMDRFTSLPEHLEQIEPGHPSLANADTQLRNKPTTATKRSRVTHRPSYEEAVAIDRSSSNEAPPPQYSEHSQNSSFDACDDRVQSLPLDIHHLLDAEHIKNLNMHMSKDFAKKFERWVGKGKGDNKENHSKAKHQPNHPPKTKTHKRKGSKPFHRQRSMSADRGAMLVSRSNNEFEKKLRQWGIKQAHDPNYYLASGRSSREEQRSAESPARLSRRDEAALVTLDEQEISPKRGSIKKNAVEKTASSSSISSQTRRSIERGRRVSPSRHKHYSRNSQGSHKSSSDAISSSSGSIEPISQLSPPQYTKGNPSGSRKSVSVDSLLSTDDSTDLDEADQFNRSHSLQRPLSMIGMRGSLETSEAISPGMQAAAPWNSDSQLLNSSNSKDVLRTINEDISRIRERKARRSDSSSDNSLEGSFLQIPTTSSPVFTLNVPVESTEMLSDDPCMYTRLNSNIANPAVELPSHSICVDSGMEMEEGEFRTGLTQSIEEDETDKTLKAPSAVADNTAAASTVQPVIALTAQIVKQSVGIIADSGTKSAAAANDLTGQLEISNNEVDKVQQNVPKSCNQVTTQNEATINDKRQSLSQQQSVPEEDGYIIVDAKLVTLGDTDESNSSSSATPEASTEDVKDKELTNQPLEPLLSSQSVSLKTKLQRLSTLYDCDDGEDMKLKQEEPSGPYDVFKAPNKASRPRSMSHDGLLDEYAGSEDALNQKPKLAIKRSSMSGLSANTDKEKVDASSSSASTSAQKVSPLLRRRLRSPVPVLDLVQKFDSQTSNNSSPAISPTQPVAPIPQMAKIADRLQQVKANKVNRYSVDLSRHVREIPKEGAVQRARSIFMDMTGT